MPDSPQSACVVFNKLTVMTVENTSGIFIGTNQAIGWSTVSKSNQGFGDVSDSQLTHTIAVVHDADTVDFPSRYMMNVAPQNNLRQHCEVSFHSVNALSVSSGSAIDVGDNLQNGWNTSLKSNYGSGKMYGSNRLGNIVNLIQDNDTSDASMRIDKRFTGGAV